MTTTPWTPAAAAALADALDHAVLDRGVPGGVLVLGTADTTAAVGRTVIARGTVAPECGPAVPDDRTRYDLASLTKITVTWALTGRALAAGRLDLDEPLRSRFPQLPAPGGWLTVRQLLAHSAGLQPETRLDRYLHLDRPLAELLCAEQLVATPGTEHRYINRGYVLLGLLLAAAHETPLDTLADRYWRELGMDETEFGPIRRSPAVAPTEQRLRGAPRTWGIPHDPNAALLNGIAGHAGVFSTAADLAAFAEHLLTAEDPWLTASLRPQIAVEAGRSRGLGWLLADTGAAYHHGYTGTSLYLSPGRGRYAVLLTNAVYHGFSGSRLTPLRDRILAAATAP
ncbi:CubicO group peptidase (beta-lactamase class C family) [Streptomyces sp. TLI_235]|nr:serine hydrolase domain-containing protein [Streptomyces sp. TLI_235]PBC72203.1 CubicO group peptidase (beta-lactamase class C family) [Streptomyces sp. TLI_235]